jgi:hypothetical protein
MQNNGGELRSVLAASTVLIVVLLVVIALAGR